MNNMELVEKLVKMSLALGADQAEVFLETNRNLSIEVRNSEIETIQEASSRGAGFRVFVENRMGFSHCNDLGNKSLEDTISRAIAFARLSSPDEHNILMNNREVTKVDGLYDPDIAAQPMDRKINMALEVENLAMKENGVSKSSGAGYSEGESEIFIGNSSGVLKSCKSSGCSLGVSVVAEKGDQKNTGSEFCTRVFFADLLPPATLAGKAAQKAVQLIDPVMIKTQRASAIFDPDVSRALLGGILAAVNGERVLQGASFLKDFLGKQIASPLLTIIDDGTMPRLPGSSPFDGEGFPVSRNVIVENGILRSYLYNTKAASRAGVPNTGNATRAGFSSLPGIGPNNVYIAAGKNTRDEIIASTEKGILLFEVTGYGIDPVSGNFSGGASGLWIEGGKVVHPVKGITIAGNAFALLNGIDMMGNDLDLKRSGSSPTFRIAEIQIGGK